MEGYFLCPYNVITQSLGHYKSLRGDEIAVDFDIRNKELISITKGLP